MKDRVPIVEPQTDAAVVLPPATTRLIAVDSWLRIALNTAKKNRFLGAVLVLASLLLFTRLNNTTFWVDEAMSGLLGQNILKTGYPCIWDGTYLVEPYFDAELAPHLIRVSHTWLQFYITAASLAVFGNTDIAARLPFALCGLASVAGIYFFAIRLSGDKRLANLSALLLATHTGFLLYSRLCRYFGPCFLLTILTSLTYLRWLSSPSKRNLCLFTICSVLLFYDHYPIWPFLFGAIALHFVVLHHQLRWNSPLVHQFVTSSVVTAVLILPWLVYANPFARGIRDWSGSTYPLRLKMFFWKLDTWVLPFVGLTAIVALAALLSRLHIFETRHPAPRIRLEYLLLTSIPLYVVIIAHAPHPMLSSQYTAPLIPFGVVVGAFLVLQIRRYSRWIAGLTLALLLATNVLQVLPFILVDRSNIAPERAEALIVNPVAQFNLGTPLAHYLSVQLRLRSPLFEYVYFLGHPYQHRLKALISYLQAHADTSHVVLAPWHDADAIRFYTKMRVIYHFKPSFTLATVKRLVYREGVTPDWIVPNAFYEPESPFFKFDPRDYQRIYIMGPKEYIFENEPNLDYFEWRTNTEAPPGFYILKRKNKNALSRTTTTLSDARE